MTIINSTTTFPLGRLPPFQLLQLVVVLLVQRDVRSLRQRLSPERGSVLGRYEWFCQRTFDLGPQTLRHPQFVADPDIGREGPIGSGLRLGIQKGSRLEHVETLMVKTKILHRDGDVGRKRLRLLDE